MTPQTEFRNWILLALGNLGGRAKKAAVLDAIDAQFGEALDDEDRTVLDTRQELRWRNNASYERFAMKKDHLLDGASARGWWELSDDGWDQYLEIGGQGMRNPTAWLMIAAGDDREHQGNLGYDDDPESHYSWDSTVANHAAPAEGDYIVLWDKTTLLGVSVIDAREVCSEVEKVRRRCPSCNKTTIKQRKNSVPAFRCYKCKHEFSEPAKEVILVTTYRSQHDRSWVPLHGCLDASTIRSCCEQPTSIQSLRRVRWPQLQEAVRCAVGLDVLGRVPGRGPAGGSQDPAGGHTERVVRVRIGQRAFRRKLEERYGNVCAFTGKQPSAALEAAHLYSYAERGLHEEHGGLLLRRDVHRLFDLGFITVASDVLTLEVQAELKDFPTYNALDGQVLKVPIPPKAAKWLAEHRRQHVAGALLT